MPLRTDLLDWVFDHLTLTYGRMFLARYDGLPVDDIRANWAEELGALNGWPEAIRFALSNLPPDRAPTVLEFRNLALRAPRPNNAPRLPGSKPKTANHPAVAHHMQAAVRAVKDGQPKGDPLKWARDVVAKHEAGKPVTVGILRMARAAIAERGHLYEGAGDATL